MSNITLDECLVWDGSAGVLLVWEILLRDIIIISGSRLLGLRYVLQPHLVLCTALRHYTSTEEYFGYIIKCVTAATCMPNRGPGLRPLAAWASHSQVDVWRAPWGQSHSWLCRSAAQAVSAVGNSRVHPRSTDACLAASYVTQSVTYKTRDTWWSPYV